MGVVVEWRNQEGEKNQSLNKNFFIDNTGLA
jgi:hypothetical protein